MIEAVSPGHLGRPDQCGEREHRIVVAARELRFVAPSSLDDLLAAVNDAEQIPFWAQVWDSSFGLSQYLESVQGRPRGKGRLLELGCGVGVTGCVAAVLGWQVTMTDHHLDALSYARRNLNANGLTAGLALADWRRFPFKGPFDLVVGSDILYEPTMHDCLEQILSGFLVDGATIVLSDPGRGYALDFAARLERAGWQSALEMQDGREGPIGIYVFKPAAE